VGVIPGPVKRVYFAGLGDDEKLMIVDEWLSTLEDGYCNKHAVFRLTESLVVRLLPELANADARELFEEKVHSVALK
jgi:hypothetical protein